jgi:hypothetical protein
MIFPQSHPYSTPYLRANNSLNPSNRKQTLRVLAKKSTVFYLKYCESKQQNTVRKISCSPRVYFKKYHNSPAIPRTSPKHHPSFPCYARA